MRQYGATRMILPELTLELGADPRETAGIDRKPGVPADVLNAMERAGLKMFVKGEQ